MICWCNAALALRASGVYLLSIHGAAAIYLADRHRGGGADGAQGLPSSAIHLWCASVLFNLHARSMAAALCQSSAKLAAKRAS